MIIYIHNKPYHATHISRDEFLKTLAEDKSVICDGYAFDCAYNQPDRYYIFYCHPLDQCGHDRIRVLPRYN